jgi:hypothetical protein
VLLAKELEKQPSVSADSKELMAMAFVDVEEKTDCAYDEPYNL